MAGYRAQARPEPGTPRKEFTLPPTLDMGLVKLEDLEFDLDREVARLHAEGPVDAETHLAEPRRDEARLI